MEQPPVSNMSGCNARRFELFTTAAASPRRSFALPQARALSFHHGWVMGVVVGTKAVSSARLTEGSGVQDKGFTALFWAGDMVRHNREWKGETDRGCYLVKERWGWGWMCEKGRGEHGKKEKQGGAKRGVKGKRTWQGTDSIHMVQSCINRDAHPRQTHIHHWQQASSGNGVWRQYRNRSTILSDHRPDREH